MEHNDKLDALCGKIRETQFDRWRDILSFLERTAEPDHTVVRFPNSSSYIFSTGADCFWMMDPAFNYRSADEEELYDLAKLIRKKISFVLLTHLHLDHCQREWVELCVGSPVKWIVSERFAEVFFDGFRGPRENTVLLGDNETIEISGVRITALSGYHNEPGTPGISSCAYDVELPDGVKLFFPADVRDPNLPVPDGEVDYTFGHVFLGRYDSQGDNFPQLEDFSRFFAKRKCSNLILNHLYEVNREPSKMWTHRNANMIKDRLAKIAPEMQVHVPVFGEAMHLTRQSPKWPDIFPEWNCSERNEFLQNLGVSLKREHIAQMQECVERKVPVVEWNYGVIRDIPLQNLIEQAEQWRNAGGRCLSLHFPVFPDCSDAGMVEMFRKYSDIAMSVRADRITIHSPLCSVGDAGKKLDGMLDFCGELLKPMLEAGISVGIENMHMKSHYRADESRPIGFVPDELLHVVNTLREKCSSQLIGCHFDLGHAYSNWPYSSQYSLMDWFRACGPLLNGLHIHQFTIPESPEKPYQQGHTLVAGRNAGHPNLHPLYEAWYKKMFRAPMILEIRDAPELQPFSSLERMRSVLK